MRSNKERPWTLINNYYHGTMRLFENFKMRILNFTSVLRRSNNG